MTENFTDIFAKIESVAPPQFLSLLERLFLDPTVAVQDEALFARKSAFLSIWENRLQIALEITKVNLWGCREFVAALGALPNDPLLKRVSYGHRTLKGLFWFLADTDELVGFVVVDVPPSHVGDTKP